MPGIFAPSHAGEDTLGVASADAVTEMRRIARARPPVRAEFGRISRLRIREQHPELRTIVTILDDEGEKYLHDFFMRPAPQTDSPVPFH